MTEYYFDDPENRKHLKEILDGWIGTPWRHHSGVKGMGCDCIHFVARVFEEMGILIWRKDLFPHYPRDWHMHDTRELLAESIEKEAKVEKVGLENLMDGDIILSHYGKAASHAAIIFDGYVYQSVTRIGVMKINFKDKLFQRQMRFAYRLLK